MFDLGLLLVEIFILGTLLFKQRRISASAPEFIQSWTITTCFGIIFCFLRFLSSLPFSSDSLRSLLAASELGSAILLLAAATHSAVRFLSTPSLLLHFRYWLVQLGFLLLFLFAFAVDHTTPHYSHSGYALMAIALLLLGFALTGSYQAFANSDDTLQAKRFVVFRVKTFLKGFTFIHLVFIAIILSVNPSLTMASAAEFTTVSAIWMGTATIEKAPRLYLLNSVRAFLGTSADTPESVFTSIEELIKLAPAIDSKRHETGVNLANLSLSESAFDLVVCSSSKSRLSAETIEEKLPNGWREGAETSLQELRFSNMRLKRYLNYHLTASNRNTADSSLQELIRSALSQRNEAAYLSMHSVADFFDEGSLQQMVYTASQHGLVILENVGSREASVIFKRIHRDHSNCKLRALTILDTSIDSFLQTINGFLAPAKDKCALAILDAHLLPDELFRRLLQNFIYHRNERKSLYLAGKSAYCSQNQYISANLYHQLARSSFNASLSVNQKLASRFALVSALRENDNSILATAKCFDLEVEELVTIAREHDIVLDRA